LKTKLLKLPFLAFGLGLFFILIIVIGLSTTPQGETVLPMLTVLFLCEFAFFMTAAGAYVGLSNAREVGFKTWNAVISLLCLFLAIGLILLGVDLWALINETSTEGLH